MGQNFDLTDLAQICLSNWVHKEGVVRSHLRHISRPHPVPVTKAVDRTQPKEEKWAFEEGEIGLLKTRLWSMIVILKFSLITTDLHPLQIHLVGNQ